MLFPKIQIQTVISLTYFKINNLDFFAAHCHQLLPNSLFHFKLQSLSSNEVKSVYDKNPQKLSLDNQTQTSLKYLQATTSQNRSRLRCSTSRVSFVWRIGDFSKNKLKRQNYLVTCYHKEQKQVWEWLVVVGSFRAFQICNQFGIQQFSFKISIFYNPSDMYYFIVNYTHPAFQFPAFNVPSYFQLTTFSNPIPLNQPSKAKNEQIALPVSEEPTSSKPSLKQKRTSRSEVFSADKKFHIIRKENKIEKVDFVDKQNIIPNNINHVLAYIQRKSKSEKLIEKIIGKFKKQQQCYNPKGFYAYQSFVKEKLSIHVNVRALQAVITHLDEKTHVFTLEEQTFYNKVSRSAIHYYLKNIAPVVTLQSQRLKNTSKEDHFKVHRFLLSLIGSLSYEEISCQEQTQK